MQHSIPNRFQVSGRVCSTPIQKVIRVNFDDPPIDLSTLTKRWVTGRDQKVSKSAAGTFLSETIIAVTVLGEVTLILITARSAIRNCSTLRDQFRRSREDIIEQHYLVERVEK